MLAETRNYPTSPFKTKCDRQDTIVITSALTVILHGDGYQLNGPTLRSADAEEKHMLAVK